VGAGKHLALTSVGIMATWIGGFGGLDRSAAMTSAQELASRPAAPRIRMVKE